MMDTEHMRDKQYSVGFGCWDANICKRHKTQQQEEPAGIDAINKIEVVKSLMECQLPLCWFIAKMQCLPVLLENM